MNTIVENMLTYVAQEIISPLCYEERKPSEIWLEYMQKQFNELCKIAHSQDYVVNFIHAIVLTEEEYEYYKNETHFRDCCDGDYVVHCLVNTNARQIVMRDDNTHQPIEEMIDNFLYGFNYYGDRPYTLTYGLYIVPNKPYDTNLFTENIKFIPLTY